MTKQYNTFTDGITGKVHKVTEHVWYYTVTTHDALGFTDTRTFDDEDTAEEYALHAISTFAHYAEMDWWLDEGNAASWLGTRARYRRGIGACEH